MESILFQDIVKNYYGKSGKMTANDHLSFSISKGEIFGLLGPNGSGKTTAVRLLTGLITPDSGTISVLGNDPIRDWKAVRSCIGLVPQDTPLYPELNAFQNLEFNAALYLKSTKEIRRKSSI